MKHIVSFSGGRTSAYLVYLMEQKRKKENIEVEYVFMDTGAEHPKTYEFVRDCVKNFNIELTCLRGVFSQKKGVGVNYKVISKDDIKHDLGPFKDLVKKYGVPYYPMGRQCTSFMKTEPFHKYCNDKYGKGNYIKWLGIRVDEPRRIKEIDNVNYLASISDFEKQDILNWWSKKEFNLMIEEWHGNCVFCIQKKVSKLALCAKEEPDLADKFQNMIEENARQKEGKDRTAMYETGLNLVKIRTIWDSMGYSANELKTIMIRSKRTDTGSCSESCEAIISQKDLFDE